MADGAVLIATIGWDQQRWAAPILAGDPGRDVRLWPDTGDRGTIRYALLWRPPANIYDGLSGLRVIFSAGAGVDHLIFRDDLPDVPIVRVVSDDLTQRMTEWVTLQVLMHHRQQRRYLAQQAEGVWRDLRQAAARQVRVGVMGMGVLGRDAAAVLARLGFEVAGWSRQRSTLPGITAFAGTAELDAFLARTDILVTLLPLTPETRGILAMPLFAKLARDGALGGPVIINGGRGGLQAEADIVAALDQGILKGASLDVFQPEPLDAASPLWRRDNVIVTPHVAASSSAEDISPDIIRQILDFEAGKPLRNVVDRKASY